MNYELPDFDTMLQLHKNDSKALDRIKKEASEALVCNASPDSQRRLRGLQFQIDMELRKSKTPLDGCIRISRMMHESLCDLQFHLKHALDPTSLEYSLVSAPIAKESADILPFTACSEA